MPACCTNCRTKYSLLIREAGCSCCALSLCKKCLSHRAIIPSLSDQPLTVCYNCYKTLEAKKIKTEATITSTPLPGKSTKNWWGDGLPPPSFRQDFNKGRASTSQTPKSIYPQINAKPTPVDDEVWQEQMRQLEERRANLMNDIPRQPEPLTIEQIEERLASLRGCDVDVIRNPRTWFQEDKRDLGNAQTVSQLMKIAEDRARLEEIDEEIEQKELKEFEERRKRLMERQEAEKKADNRESVVSDASCFSTATREQLDDINKALEDAEKRVAATKQQEEVDENELKKLMTLTRQKSLDAMQWNDKISKEIGGFWDRQNKKMSVEENDSDEDEKSLDEEAIKKIIHEAETAPYYEIKSEEAKPAPSSASPKKKGFFGKFFRKDSKS
ncbi:unnamed protein product [Caenorhabditis bovis]|uniref:FYVE-type domain-containing protein n=1 Tax=Caenorhabditis bovis TaxID=2654633 RepID=A0A8S1DZ70_9PELO|nr:unnamed protein product [Caenorhabditis bovis]